MDVNNKNIDTYYNLLDKACMIYYNNLGIDYLESFIRVSDEIINGVDYELLKLDKKEIKKLKDIYDEFENSDFLNEEARLAIELVIIKGLKHRNIYLDFLTPDSISYIFCHIINYILKYNSFSDEVNILDTVMGTSNLLQTIINNCNGNINGIGIEHDELLVHVSKAFANLLGNNLVINYNDAKKECNVMADIIIGDFGETKDCYDIILERLNNIYDKGYFIYVINNDFFNNVNDTFKKEFLNEATFVSLITLPTTFTHEKHIGKSILIGKKEVLHNYDMAIIRLNDSLDKESISNTLNKIENIFKN